LNCNRYAERLIYLSNYSLQNVTAFPVSLLKTELNFLRSLAIGVFVTQIQKFKFWINFYKPRLSGRKTILNRCFCHFWQCWSILLMLELQVCPLVPHSDVLLYIIFATSLMCKILKVINGQCLPNPHWFHWDSVCSLTL